MVYRSLTEQIYLELMEGVEKGLDWDEVLAKFGKSKGPLYNAFSRTLPQLMARCEGLFAEISQGEEKRKELDKDIAQRGERKRELDQALGDAETRLKKLNQDEAEAKERLSGYEREIQDKEALASSLSRLEELGFSSERLEELGKKVGEIGTSHRFAPNEAMSKFFDELKLWDEKLGLEADGQRLTSRKNQMEKELQEMEKRYQGKKAAVEALEELEEHGVGMRRILLWNQIVRSAGVNIGELKRAIERWNGLTEANRVEEERKKKLNEETARARASLQELDSRKAEIEGVIRATMEEGVKAVRKAGEKAKEETTKITRGIKEEIDELYSRAVKAGEKVGKIEKALPSKAEVKNLFEFISSPHVLSKDHPALFSATCSLLEWVKNNRQNLSLPYYAIEKGLETLKEELSK